VTRQWSKSTKAGTGTIQQTIDRAMREANKSANTAMREANKTANSMWRDAAKSTGAAMREAAKRAAAQPQTLRDINPVPGMPHTAEEAPAANREDGGSFTGARFSGVTGARYYKLFVPAGAQDATQPRGLIVMLHGCTQDADDFARGTRMNQLAQQANCLVLYPQQEAQHNPSKCWNWFDRSGQAHGAGEPAIIAALTRKIVTDHAVDPGRVFVGGLSAGGAMAANLAALYPELFRACGVHSGLPYGVASDVPSALAVMKSGPTAVQSAASASGGVPLIVFHGDRDTTVSPRNGADLARRAMKASGSTPGKVESGKTPAGVRYTRHTYRAQDGQTMAEHWIVHGGAHAWFGGAQTGTYTDPRGPDASAEMLRFFLQHAR
ncbi:MAG TPA: PHB depolymerase family esterase, partial [Burkholderiaceae bacterium]